MRGRFCNEVSAWQCVGMPRRIHLGSTVSCHQRTGLQTAVLMQTNNRTTI
jgi:hypothetical protein